MCKHKGKPYFVCFGYDHMEQQGGVYENTKEYVYTTTDHGVVYMKTQGITYTPLGRLMGATFL